MVYVNKNGYRRSLSRIPLAASMLLIGSVIASCGGGGNNDRATGVVPPPPPPATGNAFSVQGVAVKGLMLGGTVKVLDPSKPTEPLAESKTSTTDGSFTLEIPASANFNGPYIKILVTGGAGASMICDAPNGCSGGVSLGETVSIDDSVILTATVGAPVESGTVRANLSIFSTLTSRYAETAAGGLSESNLATANSRVIDFFNLEGIDILSEDLPNISIEPVSEPSIGAFRMALISGGFWGAALDDGVLLGTALGALADDFVAGDGTISESEVSNTATTSLEEILGQAMKLADNSPIVSDNFFVAENNLIKEWVRASEGLRKQEFEEGNFFVDMVNDTDPQILTGAVTTQMLQQAIDEASTEPNGGVVQLLQGNYAFGEIKMKENVRFEIEADTVITPTTRKLFSVAVDNNSSQIENIEITTIGREGRFLIDTTGFPVNGDIRPFLIGFAYNMSLSNFDVNDGYSKFSAIAFVPADDGQDPTNNPSFGNIPENVLVKNVSTFGTHYGYGMVQMQGGRNVLFKNIYSEGGATLRLETGSPSNGLSGPNTGGIHNIYADGVVNERGHTALHISPHVKNNGRVVAVNLASHDSAYVVQSQKGFNRDGVEGLPNGNFTPRPLIINATATRTDGAQNATIKFKDFNALPPENREGISYTSLQDTPDNESKFYSPLSPVTVLSALSPEIPGPPEDGFFGLIFDTDNIDSYADSDTNIDEVLFRREGF